LTEKYNIRSITVKKFCPTPSKEKIVECENILQRDLSMKTINEKWEQQKEYIRTKLSEKGAGEIYR